MNELITSLTQKAGITAEQAHKAVETIKDFVKEKFPMMAGAVDNLFAAAPAATATTAAAAVVDPTAPKVEGMMDKISDIIPGEAGQKVEDFVKDAADKVEDAFDSLKDKVGGLFGGDKK
jgi:tRNA A37 threonylcarbamoyladenosine dehydratase